MSQRAWWLAGCAALLPVLLLGTLLLGTAAWLPAAQQHSEEAEADLEWTGAGSGGLAAGAVPEEYRQALLEWGAYCPTLSPARLAAQIQTESAWNPDAHNVGSGAQGMAQFLPGTWAEYGTDGDGDGRADISNPLDAIASAAVYDCAVARMVAGVPGDPVDLMLAAYNAGPGAVLQHGGIPPYAETQDYVPKIRALEATFAGPGGEGLESPASGAAAAVVEAARSQIGLPYVWGGGGSRGPSGGGFDCSGLTQYAVYQATGGRTELPRTSQTQRSAGRAVSRAEMRPGDLIVINHDGNWGHVGVYAGNGRMIHAPRTGRNLADDPLDGYWSRFPWDIRRVV
ncbi:bifunctional lytic transglycosylase/C40 family peptidase [Streptomyces sp. SM12]|uniref:C40 family peptidase n=1 Tax=Streptomyces sp. SM12 TaxID=1071602 RepID=UPI000CD57C78|nr:bifunctional lytic transglycosylase/C40 family peptidase [Streptomyces sp. SM12]